MSNVWSLKKAKLHLVHIPAGLTLSAKLGPYEVYGAEGLLDLSTLVKVDSKFQSMADAVWTPMTGIEFDVESDLEVSGKLDFNIDAIARVWGWFLTQSSWIPWAKYPEYGEEKWKYNIFNHSLNPAFDLSANFKKKYKGRCKLL